MFIAAPENAALEKAALILKYVRNLDAGINNSQLLNAELVYLFFAGAECPINYNTIKDYWHVWDRRWHTTGNTLTKAKLYYQTDFLTCLRQVVRTAVTGNVFPAGADDKEHFRLTFLNKLVASVESRKSVEEIMKESAIFFAKEQHYDMEGMLFQLENCVADLRTNTFRKGIPSYLTSKCSKIHVPEKWLKKPSPH